MPGDLDELDTDQRNGNGNWQAAGLVVEELGYETRAVQLQDPTMASPGRLDEEQSVGTVELD